MAVVPDDDDDIGRISEVEDPQPPHSLTPDVFWMMRYFNMSYSER